MRRKCESSPFLPMSEDCKSFPLILPISRPKERWMQEFTVRHFLFLGVPMSGDCKSSLFYFAHFSESQWEETAGVQTLTFPISSCPIERIVQEFAFWLCQFLGVPMSSNCKCSPLDLAYFTVSQGAETARVHFLTLPISWLPNERWLQEFALWLWQFLGVPRSWDCERVCFFT